MSVYYSPENHGLEIVGTAEAGWDYEFDMFVIWRDATGQLYYAMDSGCSCPSPFEDYEDVSDLSYGTPQEVHEALDEWSDSSYYREGRETAATELHKTLAFL